MASLLQRFARPSNLSAEATDFICQTCRRHQSSYRRTSKALRVRPDAAFMPSKTETQDHIIFNPPSSAPSIYQTPMKFLPPSDPRRKLHSMAQPTLSKPIAASLGASVESSSTTSSESNPLAAFALSKAQSAADLPPPVRPVYQKKYHLDEAAVKEIRALRREDPQKWSRRALAEKFDCSQFFVSQCTEAPREHQEKHVRDLNAVKARWGRRKTEAREARKERKKIWGRDA